MDNKIKNCLGIALVAAVFVFAFSARSYVRTYSKSVEPTSFRSFAATGEGKAVAIPDVAQFTFSVITQGGRNIADLLKENTKKVNEAIQFVKSQGVEDKDIKTQSYNLEPRYQYYSCLPSIELGVSRPCPPPEIVGYTINQTVQVKVRDFDKIGGVLSGVVENGANSVSQLSFAIDDPTKVQDEARAEAIQKAKEKAKAIAKAGGFRLGRLLSIEEGGGYYPVPIYARALEAKGGFGGDFVQPPVIEPGSQEVTVNVTLRYEIE